MHVRHDFLFFQARLTRSLLATVEVKFKISVRRGKVYPSYNHVKIHIFTYVFTYGRSSGVRTPKFSPYISVQKWSTLVHSIVLSLGLEV